MSMTPLTFAQKVAIVHNLIMGDTPESIAAEHNRTVEEIHVIGRSHWSIVEVSHFFNSIKHTPVNGGLYPLMENILFCWYVEQQNVTNKQLAEKAKMILDVLNEQPRYTSQNAPVFTASNSWIAGFKARFNIATTKRKSKPRGTDTLKKVSSEDSEGNEYNSRSHSPKESELLTVIDESSSDEEKRNEFVSLNDAELGANNRRFESVLNASNDQKIENEAMVHQDDRVKTFDSEIRDRQPSADSISVVTANVKDTLNEDLKIASVVSLARIAGESEQDSTDVFAVANIATASIGLTYDNLQIESVVSLAEGADSIGNVDIDAEVTQVNQDSTDVRSASAKDTDKFGDSTCENLKIESVISLAPQDGHIRNVNGDGKTDSVFGVYSDFIGEDVQPVIATIDLTENDDDDDDTPNNGMSCKGPGSRKRKRSNRHETSVPEDPQRLWQSIEQQFGPEVTITRFSKRKRVD